MAIFVGIVVALIKIGPYRQNTNFLLPSSKIIKWGRENFPRIHIYFYRTFSKPWIRSA